MVVKEMKKDQLINYILVNSDYAVAGDYQINDENLHTQYKLKDLKQIAQKIENIFDNEIVNINIVNNVAIVKTASTKEYKYKYDFSQEDQENIKELKEEIEETFKSYKNQYFIEM